MKSYVLIVVAFISIATTNAQTSTNTILADLKEEVIHADTSADMILSNTGFNVLIQRKTINCLTGVSDLSLTKFYAELEMMS